MAENTEDQVIDQEELDQESSEESAEEELESEEQDDESEEEEEEEEEERKPSRRESLRIQQLVAKLKSKDVAPNRSTERNGLDYKTALDADEDTISQLEKDRTSYGDTRFSEGVKQAESIKFHTRLEIDAPRVEAQYPILDKKSPKFNPVVADALNSWYLSTAGYNAKTDTVTNADVRYADFIEGIMELSDEMANEKAAKTKKNIAKQAASTGLRPSGKTAKRLNLNQDPKAMTDEELDAIIGQAIPKK